MRRTSHERIRDRLAERIDQFRPVKRFQRFKRGVATKVVCYFAAAVMLIGVIAGLVAATVGG